MPVANVDVGGVGRTRFCRGDVAHFEPEVPDAPGIGVLGTESWDRITWHMVSAIN